MSILNRPQPFYFNMFPWSVATPLNANHEATTDPDAPLSQDFFLLLSGDNFLLLDGTDFLLLGE